MRILGIDPGVTGACALIEGSGKFIDCFDMPTVLTGKTTQRAMVNQFELAKLLRVVVTDSPDCIAVVEYVTSMQEWGHVGSFTFGKSYGIILGVLGALGVSTELVVPRKWKGYFSLDGTGKDAARELAQRMWPQAPLGLKKHHARADALLIARWYADRMRRDNDPERQARIDRFDEQASVAEAS